jgi:hypothetical protein
MNTTLIQSMNTQKGWYVVKVKINAEDAIQKSITPSKLYRDLSNSKQSFNSYLGNNRTFWKKNIKGGFYHSSYSDDGLITIYFFVQFNFDLSEKMIRTNIIVRLKRIIPCEVQIGGIEILSPHLQQVFQIEYGMENLLQPFGGYYNSPSLEMTLA